MSLKLWINCYRLFRVVSIVIFFRCVRVTNLDQEWIESRSGIYPVTGRTKSFYQKLLSIKSSARQDEIRLKAFPYGGDRFGITQTFHVRKTIIAKKCGLKTILILCPLRFIKSSLLRQLKIRELWEEPGSENPYNQCCESWLDFSHSFKNCFESRRIRNRLAWSDPECHPLL